MRIFEKKPDAKPKIFDWHAERYDFWYHKHPILFECEAKVIRALKLRGRGLSIGVGTGILDSQAPVEIGIDPAVNMLRLASDRGIKPVQAKGEHLPFKDRCFDFVLMTVTLCFLDSPKEAILEIRRVIRSKGKLAICIVPKDSAWGKEYMKKAKSGHVFYRYAHFYTLNELKKILWRYSFKTVAVKTTLSYPPSTKPRTEEPSENPEGKGFVCVKALKT